MARGTISVTMSPTRWFGVVSTPVFLAAALFAIVARNAASAADAKEPAEIAGFSTERLARLDHALQSAVDKKQIAGSVVLIARDGKTAKLSRGVVIGISPRSPGLTCAPRPRPNRDVRGPFATT